MSTTPIPDGQPMSRRTMFRRRAAAGLTQPVFRYPFNTTLFDHWSTDLAWLTGLIWSDGCLFRNSIEICSKDRDLLETVAALIDMPNGIRPKNHGRAWRIIFTDIGVARMFRELGLTPAKSLTAPWPDLAPDLYPAFVRGLLDGDGSVMLRQDRPGQQAPDLRVHWYGAAPAIREGLLAWLDQQELAHQWRISHHTVWDVSVSRQADVRRLYTLLYPTPHVPTLLRKRADYDRWVAAPRRSGGRPKASDPPASSSVV